MGKTHRQERTRPKQTKPKQSRKYADPVLEVVTEMESEYEDSCYDDELESYHEYHDKCFCHETDISHCGKCYHLVDGKLVHKYLPDMEF